MTDTPFRQRIVRCPACGGPSIYAPDNPARPFCSQRCKDNDFGAWASERYSLPAQSSPDDDSPESSVEPNA